MTEGPRVSWPAPPGLGEMGKRLDFECDDCSERAVALHLVNWRRRRSDVRAVSAIFACAEHDPGSGLAIEVDDLFVSWTKWFSELEKSRPAGLVLLIERLLPLIDEDGETS